VVEDAPAGSIVRGNPARVVGRVKVEGAELNLEFFGEGEADQCAE
jgi:acetyltransferase-like isoleucine patch superfamily enzyme